MKRYIFCLLIALFSIASYSQDVVKEGKTFKVQTTQTTSEQQTEYTWEDKKGVKYPIYISKKGALYIKRTSPKGKEYKQYLSKEAQKIIKKELK
jgi:hypothetical protein